MPMTAGEQGFTSVHKAVESAKELGGLDACAIWALLCLVLVAYLWYIVSQQKKSDIAWQKIREEEAQADVEMSNSVRKMVDILMRLQIIVDERIPRGDKRV